jgi:hypothetical protein
MPTFFWLALGVVLAFGVLLAIVFTVAVKAGKLKVKKGGAPGTSSSSGGIDSSMF